MPASDLVYYGDNNYTASSNQRIMNPRYTNETEADAMEETTAAVDPLLNKILNSDTDNDQKLCLIQQLMNRRMDESNQQKLASPVQGLMSPNQKNRVRKTRLHTSRKNKQLMQSYNVGLVSTEHYPVAAEIMMSQTQTPQKRRTGPPLFNRLNQTQQVQHITINEETQGKALLAQTQVFSDVSTAPPTATIQSRGGSQLANRRTIDCNTQMDKESRDYDQIRGQINISVTNPIQMLDIASLTNSDAILTVNSQGQVRRLVQAKLRAQTAKQLVQSPERITTKVQRIGTAGRCHKDVTMKKQDNSSMFANSYVQTTPRRLRDLQNPSDAKYKQVRTSFQRDTQPQFQTSQQVGFQRFQEPLPQVMRTTLPVRKVKSILQEFNNLPSHEQQDRSQISRFNERLYQKSVQTSHHAECKRKHLEQLQPVVRQYDKFIQVRKQFVRPIYQDETSAMVKGTKQQIDESKERRDAKALKSQLIQVYGEQLLVEPDFEQRCNHHHREQEQEPTYVDVKSRSSQNVRSLSSGRGYGSGRHSAYRHSHRSPKTPKNIAQTIIARVAQNTSQKSHDNFTMMLTNANELLTRQGIHGKVARVGIGFGTGRHTAKLHQINRDYNAGRVSSAGPFRKPLVVPDEEPSTPKRARSPVQKRSSVSRLCYHEVTSIRSKNEQVSHGRFDAFQFDANCQTDYKLILSLTEKPTQEIDVETDPVTFAVFKEYTNFMIQTDPMIVEPDSPREPEGLCITKDKVAQFSVQPNPIPEFLPVFEKPIVVDHHDWAESALFEHVRKDTIKDLTRRGLIITESENDEGPGTPACSTTSSVADARNLNPLQLEILQQMECEYLISIVKKQTNSMESTINQQELDTCFQLSKVTCEVLVANMIAPELMNNIFFSHYTLVTPTNATKLLMRVNQLYQVRQRATKILQGTLELDFLFKATSQLTRLLRLGDRIDRQLTETEQEVLEQVRKNVLRVQQDLTEFKREIKLYKREFIYLGQELSEVLVQRQTILKGFQCHRNGGDCSSFKEWLADSVNKVGQKLDEPDQQKLKQILVEKQAKESRVAKVVVPPAKQTTPEKKRPLKHRPISPIIVKVEVSSSESEDSEYAQKTGDDSESSGQFVNQPGRVGQMKAEYAARRMRKMQRTDSGQQVSVGNESDYYTTNFDKWEKKNYTGNQLFNINVQDQLVAGNTQNGPKNVNSSPYKPLDDQTVVMDASVKIDLQRSSKLSSHIQQTVSKQASERMDSHRSSKLSSHIQVINSEKTPCAKYDIGQGSQQEQDQDSPDLQSQQEISGQNSGGTL